MTRLRGRLLAPKLLVFQTAYPHSLIESLGLESYLESKDPGQYFEKILVIDSIASLQDVEFLRSGKTYRFHVLNEKYEMVEGAHRIALLGEKCPKLSFLMSQLNLIFRLLFHGHLRSVSLVYADDALYNGFLGFLISRLLKVPLVIGIWGNPDRIRENTGQPLMPRLFRGIHSEARFEQYFLKKAAAIQVQNRENGTYPLSLGISPSRVTYLPLGGGISDFHFIPPSARNLRTGESTIDTSIFNIVCISRLEELKHVDHVIRSLEELYENSIRFQLHIIGSGSQEEQLAIQAQKMGLIENIAFHGMQSQEWIASFLVRMDLAVAPLTGRALLEIGLAGLPVVAYDIDWHNEIVIDGETGKLVEYLNYKALGSALLEFYQKGEVPRKIFGERMRLRSVKLCDAKLIGETQNNFYEKIIG